MNIDEEVVEFLLHKPPLEEIGGSLCTIIESYRFGTIPKEQAILEIFKNWSCFIEKYIEQDKYITKRIKN